MFESHITVENEIGFVEKCKLNNIKSVLIANDSGSNYINQSMTASFHKTNDFEFAFQQMKKISSLFKNVIRNKLEKIVSKKTKINFDYKYKEFHSKFIIKDFQHDEFLHIILSNGGHTSTNLSKGSNFRFFTTRDEKLHDFILKKLKSKFEYLGTIREVVVYDDNPNIDSNYICKECPLKKYVN